MQKLHLLVAFQKVWKVLAGYSRQLAIILQSLLNPLILDEATKSQELWPMNQQKGYKQIYDTVFFLHSMKFISFAVRC